MNPTNLPPSNLHHERAGHGPTILFLHGFMGAADDWLPITNLLEPHFDCIRIDLPGHGRTPAPPHNITANIAWMARQIRAFLTTHNIARPHLVGYSMGARIALLLALNHPQEIQSLTIESSEPGLQNPKTRTDRTRLDTQRAQSIRTLGLNHFLDQWYAAPLFQSLSNHPDFPQTLARRRLQNPEAIAKIIQDTSPGNQANLWPRVAELTMRSLWITGQLDTKYTPIITRAASLAPNATLQILPHAGHNSHLEQPQQFAQTLKHFLLTT